MKSIVRNSLETTRGVIDALLADEALVSSVEKVGQICVEALKSRRKVLLAGNGGSAADCQHIAAELVSRFNYDRPGLAGIALTTDTSALLAIGNDYGFERVFARQLEALGQTGDVFFGISTSGNSPNILAALSTARTLGIKTIGMTGGSGGKMAALCDISIRIPSSETPRIQECHIMLGHIICQIIEDSIFGQEHAPK